LILQRLDCLRYGHVVELLLLDVDGAIAQLLLPDDRHSLPLSLGAWLHSTLTLAEFRMRVVHVLREVHARRPLLERLWKLVKPRIELHRISSHHRILFHHIRLLDLVPLFMLTALLLIHLPLYLLEVGSALLLCLVASKAVTRLPLRLSWGNGWLAQSVSGYVWLLLERMRH